MNKSKAIIGLMLILSIMAMPFIGHCQYTIMPSYDGSKDAPIRVSKGDTVIFLLEGYFINNDRYRMYQTVKKAAEKQRLRFSDVYLDITKYVDEQNAVVKRLSDMSESASQQVREARDASADLGKVIEQMTRDNDATTEKMGKRIKELEVELSTKPKTRKWPLLAIPVAFAAGFIIAR